TLLFQPPSTPQRYTLSLHDALPILTSFTSPCNNFDGVALEIHTSNLVGARFGKAQNFGRLKGQTGRLPQIGQNRCNAAGCTIHRSEEHTSELQSRFDLVCRLLLEKK